ncbi:MAG: T9SS type A sorting domain-containing protein, partial [bacterium]
MVANPFNISVEHANLSLDSDTDVLGSGDMYKYLSAWSVWDAGNIDPWGGFLVYTNDGNAQLLIDPGLPAVKSAPVKSPAPLWAVNIDARVGQAVDAYNAARVMPEASLTWDNFDGPEPPVIGKYVSLSFPHPEWDEPARNFAVDARPVPEDGDIWDLEVRTNVQDMVHLSFSGLESVPEEYQVWLHDELLEMNINLRETTRYSFVGTSEQYSRRLKLVIGNADFIRTEMPAGELMPQRVELSQNFPNPFNPVTTIKFGLPREARVRLNIYDVRGRLVTKLLDNKLIPAGRHAEVWDGTDRSDRRVASGVYLYRLQVGDAVKTQKMVLMK